MRQEWDYNEIMSVTLAKAAIACLLTIALETPIWLFFFQERKPLRVPLFLLMNLVTNISLNAILLNIDSVLYRQLLFPLESIVYVLEAIIGSLITKQPKKSILASLIANTLSLGLGIGFSYIPNFYDEIPMIITGTLLSVSIIVTIVIYLVQYVRQEKRATQSIPLSKSPEKQGDSKNENDECSGETDRHYQP